MIKLKSLITESRIAIYRGISQSNKKYDNYYTPNKEWARQFTQSSLDKEINKRYIDTNTIYKANPLPSATNEEEINNAIQIAAEKGFKAIWLDEGMNEPPSIYIVDKTAFL